MEKTDPADEVVSTLRKIIRAIDLQSRKLTKSYGLTGPQLLVLKETRKNPQAPISSISKQVSLSQATVTSILDRLEQQDFVQRVRSHEDKRRVIVQLKEKAIAILDQNPSLLQEEFILRFGRLEEWEKTMLLSSLQRMATMMNAENIESPPVLVSGPIAASPQEVKRYLDEDDSLSD